MRIAVDIGGTFTDLVAIDDQGQIYRSKSLTTPDDLARAIQDCLNAAKIQVSKASFFVHGSTVTINAVLERKGARTGLITTKGFRDVYEIGRGNRPEGYNLFFKRPVPLVSRDLRLEVEERLYASGEVQKPLDESSASETIGALKAAGVESVWHLYVVRHPRRDQIKHHLEAHRIGCALHYPLPLHLQKAYAHLGYKPGDFPVAEKAANECLSLPIYPEMTDAQIDRVGTVLKSFFAK